MDYFDVPQITCVLVNWMVGNVRGQYRSDFKPGSNSLRL